MSHINIYLLIVVFIVACYSRCSVQLDLYDKSILKTANNEDNNTVSLSIALAQVSTKNGNKTHQIEQIEQLATELSSEGVQLLVFPELYLVGYSLRSDSEIVKLSEEQNGKSMQKIMQIAKNTNMNIIYGYVEKGDLKNCNNTFPLWKHNIYDAVAVISSNGELLLNYRKTHLSNSENLLYTEGGVIGPIVEIENVKVGICICIEVYYPEISRTLALLGAEMILIPTANAYPANVFNQPAFQMVPARASENSIPVAYINYYQPWNVFYKYYGNSILAFPNNVIKGSDNSTDIIKSVLTFEKESNEGFLSSRRPKLYQGVCEDNDYDHCTDKPHSLPI